MALPPPREDVAQDPVHGPAVDHTPIDPGRSTALPPISAGPTGRSVPNLTAFDTGDSLLGITPSLDSASFQDGWLGMDGERAFVRGDVQAKLGERLYVAFDLLELRIHFHALERTSGSRAILFSSSLPLWTPPDPATQVEPSQNASRFRIPTSTPFEFRLTPDLPQCVHLPSSTGVRYMLTTELLVTPKISLSTGSSHTQAGQIRKLATSVPVHLVRYLAQGPLKRILSPGRSDPEPEPEPARGHPPDYSDEPSTSDRRRSSTSFVTADPGSDPSEPDPSSESDPARFASANGVHIPPGYSLSPHIWSARYPTVVHAQLARTLFRRGEAMRINVLIPPPPQGLATEKGLSLRSVEARLVRVITVTEPPGAKGAQGVSPTTTSANPTPADASASAGPSSSALGPAPEAGPSHLGTEGNTSSSSGGKGKQVVYEAQLSYSGKLARFNSSRPITLRLALHSPYRIACPPGPSPEIDRALYDVCVSSPPQAFHSTTVPLETEGESSAAAMADADATQGNQREGTACASISQETLFHKVEFEVRVRIALSSSRARSRSPSPEHLTSDHDAGDNPTKATEASSSQHPDSVTQSGRADGKNPSYPSIPPLASSRAPGASQERPRDVHIRFSQKVHILPGIPPEAGVGLNSDGNPLWLENLFVDADDILSQGEGAQPTEVRSGEPGSSTTAATHSNRAEKMRAAEALVGVDDTEATDLGRGGRVFEGFDQLEEFDGYEDQIIYEDGGAGPSGAGLDQERGATAAAGQALLGTGLGSGPPQSLSSLPTHEPQADWDAPPAEEAPPPVGADDELNEFELRMGMEIGRRIAAIGADGPVPQWTPGEDEDDLCPPPGEPPEESEAHADAHAALAGACAQDPPPPLSPPAWSADLEHAHPSELPTRGASESIVESNTESSWDAPPASAPPPDGNHPDPMGLRLAAAARQLSLNLGPTRGRSSGTRLNADPPPSFGDAMAPDAPALPPQDLAYAYPLPPSLPGSRRTSGPNLQSALVRGLHPTLHTNVDPPAIDQAGALPPPPYRGSHENEGDAHDPHRTVQPPSYSDAGLLSSSIRPPHTSTDPTPPSNDQELPTYAEYDRH